MSSPRTIARKPVRRRGSSEESCETGGSSSLGRQAAQASSLQSDRGEMARSAPGTPLRRIASGMSFSFRRSSSALVTSQANESREATPSPPDSPSMEAASPSNHQIDTEFCATAVLLVPEVKVEMDSSDWDDFKCRFEPGVEYSMEHACMLLARAIHIVDEDALASQSWIYRTSNPLNHRLIRFIKSLTNDFIISEKAEGVSVTLAATDDDGAFDSEQEDVPLDGLGEDQRRIIDVTTSAVKAKDLVSRIEAVRGECMLSRKARFMGAFAELDILADKRNRRDVARRIVDRYMLPGAKYDIGYRMQSNRLFDELNRARVRAAKELAESSLIVNLTVEAMTPRMRPARLTGGLHQSASSPLHTMMDLNLG